MPVALLKYDKYAIPDWLLSNLVSKLPEVIANALDTPENPDTRLSSGDIEIWVQPHHQLDRNVKPLELMIFAHDFPERLRNIDERTEKITQTVREILCEQAPKITGWVWIHLTKTAFGRIQK